MEWKKDIYGNPIHCIVTFKDIDSKMAYLESKNE